MAGKTDGRLVTQLKIRTKSGAILGPVGGGAGQVEIIINLIMSLFYTDHVISVTYSVLIITDLITCSILSIFDHLI